jgi:pentatricopeptide repeat protein
MDYALHLMQQLQLKPTIYTFNTLLDRCAVDRDLHRALGIMRSMQNYQLAPDIATFNTLLKICIRTEDVKSFEEVIL